MKIANARDLAKARDGATQIVKFHGDFGEEIPSSSPKRIISTGCAFIRLLLHWLWRTWQKSGYERDRPQSFIFMAHENDMQAAVLKQWSVVPLRGDVEDPEQTDRLP